MLILLISSVSPNAIQLYKNTKKNIEGFHFNPIKATNIDHLFQKE